MKKCLLSLLFLCAIIVYGHAQTKTVSGIVKDDQKMPLPGVNVVLKSNPSQGTITDIDGKYALEVTDGEVLVFRFIGMKSQEVPVGSQTTIDVVMESEFIGLDEVVAVGYGVQKKSDITGAVASVKFDELPIEGISNVDQALQGRMAGVQVTANTGSPGGSISVRVRGIATVNNSDPLYVVDGLPVDNIDFLNPNDINSIEVLKDASASAIYGSRGANGVVLVTTKKGSYGDKANITLTAYYGSQQVINNWETTSGSEWYAIQEEMNKTRTEPIDLTQVDKNVNTDWFKEITRVAPMKDVNLNINGGTEKMTYSLSIGHFDQDGTIEKTSFERNNIKLNSEFKATKRFTVGTNLNIQKNERNSLTFDSYHTGVINTALKLEPVIPVFQEDGAYDYSKFTDYPNPVAQIEYENSSSELLTVNGNIYGQLELMDGLSFKTSLGMSTARSDSYGFVPVYFVNTNQQNLINKVTRGYSRSEYYNWENTLNYNKTFGKHTVGGLVGYTIEETDRQGVSASKQNIPNEEPFMWYLDAAAEGDLASGWGSEFSYMSYLGRTNYSFDNKYLVTINFRADASSRFPESNKWGYFPSFALGWKVTEESFMPETDWLSSLKLRTGWGQVGNDKIGNYPYQSTMNGNNQYRYLFGDEVVNQGYVVTGMVDPEIKWETVESLNIGFDALLFGGMIETSFDWYKKTTKDMLLRVPIPYYFGYESGPTSNVGDVENKGIEFAINHQNQLTNGFKYNVGFNISTVKNKVTSIGNSNPFSAGAYYGGNATRFDVDESIGYFYGYVTDGLFQSQAEIDKHAVQQGTANEKLMPGDLRFKDINGRDENGELTGLPDGKIDGDDRTNIGSPIPDFIYGINLGCSYKGFDVSMFFQGSEGNEIFNAMKTHLYKFDETNKHKDMLNSWTPGNTNTDMPRLSGSDQNNTNRTSDRFVEDGSYIRLKNLTVGYNLPKSLTNRVGLSSFRVYFSGQNLWTKTKYSGADPEVGQRSSTNYLSNGVDIGNYPLAKVYSVGVKVGF